MAFYNRKKVTYQQAQSHNPLLLSPSDNGVNWIMMKEYVYEVGKIGSGDKIKVPEGFITDFATIPRPFWSFLPPWGKYGKAAIVHDYLYDNAIRARKESDQIFLEIMRNSDVNTLIRYIIYYSVRTFGWIFYNRDNKSKQVHLVSTGARQHAENNATDSKRSFWIVLIIGSFLMVVSPWIFTQHWFGQFFKFGEATGPIGDTVGGLTAPIIGLMSAILVYLTLHEQVKANEMQRRAIAKQSQENILSQELTEIREGLNKIEKEMNNWSYEFKEVLGKVNGEESTKKPTYHDLLGYLIKTKFTDKDKVIKFIQQLLSYTITLELFSSIQMNKVEKQDLFNCILERFRVAYLQYFKPCIREMEGTHLENDSTIITYRKRIIDCFSFLGFKVD